MKTTHLKPIAEMTAAEYAALTGPDLDYRAAVEAYERACAADDENPNEGSVHDVNFAHEEMEAARRATDEHRKTPPAMRNAHRIR